MGWVVASACSKDHRANNPINYLEIYVSSDNQESITQIQKFMQYLNNNITGINKEMKYANIKDIIIRFYDGSGSLNHIYQGNDLNEERYDEIITKLNTEWRL